MKRILQRQYQLLNRLMSLANLLSLQNMFKSSAMATEINLNELSITKLNTNKNNKIGTAFFILEYSTFIIIYTNDSAISIISVNARSLSSGVVDVS